MSPPPPPAPNKMGLRNNIAEMLGKVTSDVKVEPALKPLFGEESKGNQTGEARSDISAR